MASMTSMRPTAPSPSPGPAQPPVSVAPPVVVLGRNEPQVGRLKQRRGRLSRALFPEDGRLLVHRLWYLLALGLGAFGVAQQQPALLVAAILVLAVSIAPEVWYHRGLRNLVVETRWSAQRAFHGETVALRIRVENRKLLPLPWVRVEHNLPEALDALGGETAHAFRPRRYLLADTLSLWSWQGMPKRRPLLCAARGVYQLGPITIRTSDPLGWLVREREIAPPATSLLVYPLIAPIDHLNVAALFPFGMESTPRTLMEDPLRLAGVREYRPGDDPRLIHWKATARAGELRRKVLDPSGQYRFVLLLDVNTVRADRYPVNPDLLEFCVSVAASIASWALDKGYPTGLLSNGKLAPYTDDEDLRAPLEEAQARYGTRFLMQPRHPGALTTSAALPDAPVFPWQRAIGQAPPPQAGALSEQNLVWLAPSNYSSQSERMLTALAQLTLTAGAPIEALAATQRRVIGTGASILLITTTRNLRQETVDYLDELRRHGVGAHLILVGPRSDAHGIAMQELPAHYIGGKEEWYELVNAARRGEADIPALRLD